MNIEGRKNIFSDLGWVFTGNIVILFVVFILRITIARYLGAKELGVYTIILSVYTICTLLITVGIPVALIKYAAEYRDIFKKLRELYTTSLFLTILLGAILTFIFVIFAGRLSNILNIHQYKNLLIFLGFVFPICSAFQVSLGFLNGVRNMKYYALSLIFQYMINLVVTLVLMISNMGLISVLWGLLISHIIIVIVQAIYLHHLIIFKVDKLWNNTKTLTQFGVKIFGVDVVNQINYHADILILSALLSASEVGYYAVAIAISRLIWIIPECVQKITYPASSEYWAKNNMDKLADMVNKSVKYSALLLSVLCLGIFFYSEDVIYLLFGKEFNSSVLPLHILLLGGLIHGSLIRPIAGVLAGTGRPDLALKKDMVSVVTNISMNLILIPQLGIVGAAIAQTSSLLVNTIIGIFFFIKIINVKVDLKSFLGITAINCVAVSIFIILINFMNNLLLGSIVLIFFIFMILKFFIDTEDREIIKSFIA